MSSQRGDGSRILCAVCGVGLTLLCFVSCYTAAWASDTALMSIEDAGGIAPILGGHLLPLVASTGRMAAVGVALVVALVTALSASRKIRTVTFVVFSLTIVVWTMLLLLVTGLAVTGVYVYT